MTKKTMDKFKSFAQGATLVGILAVGMLALQAYSGSAPKVVVEGDYIEAESAEEMLGISQRASKFTDVEVTNETLVRGALNASSTAIIDGAVTHNSTLTQSGDVTVSSTALFVDAYFTANLGGAMGINTTTMNGELVIDGQSATSSITLDTNGSTGSCIMMADADGDLTALYLTANGSIATSTTDCR